MATVCKAGKPYIEKLHIRITHTNGNDMLTIENINLISSKFAGTPHWIVSEVFVSEGCYVFQIRKRVGEWTILGMKQDEITIRLARERLMGGYVMETQVIKQNYKSRSMHEIKDMRTITDFIRCLDNHISNTIIK